MGRSSYFIIGAVVGAAVGVAVNYLFGPAADTPYDSNYRSRLDAALEAGDRAADAREMELRNRFIAAKSPAPRFPDDLNSELPSSAE